ncbi:hypothetical protein GCM10010177_29210 [Actinomadura citrea]|nr:hypothetical protein GCM10010177_29210 [Actinomadura citrea]
MLGYALDAEGWREENVSLDAEPELLPALASLFEWQADRPLRQHTLDLDQPPATLLAAVRRLTERLEPQTFGATQSG